MEQREDARKRVLAAGPAPSSVIIAKREKRRDELPATKREAVPLCTKLAWHVLLLVSFWHEAVVRNAGRMRARGGLLLVAAAAPGYSRREPLARFPWVCSCFPGLLGQVARLV